MRVIDHRYTGERRRFDLAVRMIAHEARTQTIRLCTGLSDDRIRKLYRTYFQGGAGSVKRRRGKSPRQAAYFTRNTRNQLEATIMAMLLRNAGLLKPAGTGRLDSLRTNLDRGVLFCFVYETYLFLATPAPLSFEHAWYLVEAIHCGYDLDLTACDSCRLSFVRDPLALRPKICPSCSIKDRDAQRRTR